MTAYPGPGSAVDRVGGRSELEAIVREHVGARGTWDLGIDSTLYHYHLNLTDGDGRLLAELRSVRTAVSAAVRDDQLSLLEDDRRELEPVIRAIVDALLEESTPPLERAAMEGDR